MHEHVNEKVSVVVTYDRSSGQVFPTRIRWQTREYVMTTLGYYHKRKVGRTILHIFEVTDGELAFRLQCNPETLQWTLEEVSDGLAA